MAKVIVGRTDEVSGFGSAVLLVAPSVERLVRHDWLQLLTDLRLVLEADENEFVFL